MSEPTPGDFESEIDYLRTTPVTDILANQLFVLFQIAAMYLGESPARLADSPSGRQQALLRTTGIVT